MLFVIGMILSIGVGVACLLWLARGRPFGSIEPQCAACGYIVHGLPAPKCPECGSDLTRPRAVVTTGRLPPGRLFRSIAWSIFCALAVVVPVAFIWTAFVMPALPQVRESSNDVTLYQPASKRYQSIAIRAHSRAILPSTAPDPFPNDLTIELTRSGGTTRLIEIDSTTLHFRDRSVPGSTMNSTPLDADALVSWLKDAGVPGETDQLKKEMAVVMAQLHQAVTIPQTHQLSGNTQFGGMGGSSGSSMSPLPWAAPVPLLIGAIVWVIGIIRIVRRPLLLGDSHVSA